MYSYESDLARLIIEERIREANQHRLAREFKRREQPSISPIAVGEPHGHSLLWRLAHVRQAYS